MRFARLFGAVALALPPALGLAAGLGLSGCGVKGDPIPYVQAYPEVGPPVTPASGEKPGEKTVAPKPAEKKK